MPTKPAPPSSARRRIEPAWVLRVDPSLDDLPIPVLARQWAKERGATTLRQLARVDPKDILAVHPDATAWLDAMRAVLERLFGWEWEELAALDVLPRPSPRRPTRWDELRLVLPDMLYGTLLEEIELPHYMEKYVRREGLVTLGQLAGRSEARLSAAQNLGRGSIHKTFKAVLALALRDFT